MPKTLFSINVSGGRKDCTTLMKYLLVRFTRSAMWFCFGAGGWEGFTVWVAARSLTHSSYCTLWRCCKWWKRLVVLERLVATCFRHSLRNTLFRCSSDTLNPNRLQIIKPLFFFLPTSSSAACLHFCVCLHVVRVKLCEGKTGREKYSNWQLYRRNV